MNSSVETKEQESTGGAFQLSPEQVRYFETFGFVKVPRLFADDLDEIIDGFEAIFQNDAHYRMETHHPLHGEQLRVIIPVFIDKDPRLSRLREDPRVLSIIRSLIGERYEYAESDGNTFYCESSWHPDTYGAPMEQYHVKLSFYLDPLSAESGAIRMIPGTNYFDESFAVRLRSDLDDPARIRAVYGVDAADIPSFALASEPGDVIAWNYRTIHASYRGGARRRLFSISFRAPRA